MLLEQKQNISFPPFCLFLHFSVLWMSDANSLRAEMVLYNNRDGSLQNEERMNSVLGLWEMETRGKHS